MIIALLQFCVSAAVIVVAGTFLTRFADAISEITGLGRLVVGSVLLAAATSLPELTVDLSAVLMGLPDLAVGDLLGSSLMNLLILAILDLSHHSRGRMLSRQGAAHALSGSVSIGLTAVVALGLLTGKAFAPYAIFGVSPAIFVLVIGYALGVRLVYLDQRIAIRTAKEEGKPVVSVSPEMTLGKAMLGFAACAGAILVAGPFLAESAGDLARLSGLGATFVGTTLVAFSTSLPELVSMIAALRMGAFDLAIGNVFGSNAFNMILFLPLDVFHRQSLFAAVAPRHAVTCVAVVLATELAVMGQLYQAESRTRLIEPDAWLVILVVAGALALIYYLP
ncbi:MAG: sodium:calcium antiporter [Planctomycetes bacterium]|nr:sodium:calcium antiporter [Planctomycetota bacterium]